MAVPDTNFALQKAEAVCQGAVQSMETNTLLVFPVQLSKLCLRSNVANAANLSARRHMCGSDHRSNHAHLTLAAWTSAIWDSSMSASRRSLDGVPPIVQDGWT